MPKISVIVPIYGVEKFLRKAVNSILNQTLTDLEIILVDDGGKDNCPHIIDEYSAKDSRIIAIHKPNGGYGQSMNIGLDRATGEYIAILEPDDYIDSKMYEDLYAIAKEYDSDIVKSCFYENLQCPQITTLKKPKWDDYIPENRSFTINEYPYFLRYHPSVWSCIYKREFLNKNCIRFIEASGAGWTDNPFQVQTMCLAERINYTSKAYYYWRKLKLYEADDLKDYRIPFERSSEIHNWLQDNHICDENILANLYRRELAYIQIVLKMRKISDIKDCYSRIRKMCKCMNEQIILNNPQIKNREKKIYFQAKNHPLLLRFILMFNHKRKSLFQVHINDIEILIKLFGKVLVQRNKIKTI